MTMVIFAGKPCDFFGAEIATNPSWKRFFSGDLTWQQWPDWIAGPRLPRLRGFARVHRFVSLRCPWLTETVQRTLRSQLEHLEVAQRSPETCT